jgi:hypothetical protein
LTTAYGAGLRGRRLKATRCGMGLYDKLILPRLLDMAMRNEQLTVYRE